MGEIEETAKATQEVAKATARGIDAARDLGGFFEKILGRGFAQLGGAFSDWATVYRYENGLKLADRVEALHRERGIEGKTVPIAPRLAIPLLQNATLEDDDTLQGMWAALIANATDPTAQILPRRNFVSILASLEPLDAHALMVIHADEIANPPATEIPLHAGCGRRNAWWLATMLELHVAPVKLSIETLDRLNLIKDDVRDEPLETGEAVLSPLTHPNAHFVLTYTGRALLKACSP